MAYRKDPFGMTRSANRTLNSMFKVGTNVVKAMAREAKAQQHAYEKQQIAYQRYLAQVERNRVRQIKEQEAAARRSEREREAATRREERERAKAERERQKAAILQAKIDEQQRIEAEIKSIDDENELWTNIHKYIDDIITIEDVKAAISNSLIERSNLQSNGLFTEEYPKEDDFRAAAEAEAKSKFLIQDYESAVRDRQNKYNTAEGNYNYLLKDGPKRETIISELTEKAANEIKSFWPWKAKRLRQEYVDERINACFTERYKAWQKSVEDYKNLKEKASHQLDESKKALTEQIAQRETFVKNKTSESFKTEVEKWTKERELFFDSYLKAMNRLLDGDKEYVLKAINDSFADDAEELPMEYYLDISYDESTGVVKVDLDLPEIEDIPEKKVVVNPSGKKSIRGKTQTNLKEDYANCVCGLSMYVAGIIFNTCLKIWRNRSMPTQPRGSKFRSITTQKW